MSTYNGYTNGYSNGYSNGYTNGYPNSFNRNGRRSNDNFEFNIVEHIGVLGETENGWLKAVNMVAWNGGIPKLDIREWQPDYRRMKKGITLMDDEAERLAHMLAARYCGMNFGGQNFPGRNYFGQNYPGQNHGQNWGQGRPGYNANNGFANGGMMNNQEFMNGCYFPGGQSGANGRGYPNGGDYNRGMPFEGQNGMMGRSAGPYSDGSPAQGGFAQTESVGPNGEGNASGVGPDSPGELYEDDIPFDQIDSEADRYDDQEGVQEQEIEEGTA